MSVSSESVHRLHAATHTQGRRALHRGRQRKEARNQLFIEPLEARCLLSCTGTAQTQRTITGVCNNLTNETWGSANTALLRIGPSRYGDGISTPSGATRPSGRVISNRVVDQGDADIISDRQLSAMIYAWGQFIDHDMDLTGTGSERFDITIPRCDPFFDPSCTGTQIMPFSRSLAVAGTGTGTTPRQQPNQITAFLDASMVYGSDPTVAGALRTFSGGRLKTNFISGLGNFLPNNNTSFFTPAQITALNMANDAHRFPDDQMTAAGDVRANENIELNSLHTLFVREHNRIADALRAENPFLSDETLFQLARKQVGAEIQVITYREWIPALLGANALPAYTGYRSNVNPGIANEFSTALFRVGHSMLGNDVEFLDNNGLPVADEIPLSEAFFNPTIIPGTGGNPATGISPILKYLASDPSSEIDSMIVGSVRNFLFGPPGAGGFDLASRNIQRGRDHGIANYNRTRQAYGLALYTSFSQITSNTDLAARLSSLYNGNINDVDLWVGALAEDHVPGTSTGRLIRTGLIDQFTRLRDGDRFWYQLVYSTADQQFLENNRRLADIIRLNTAADVIQDNIFFFRVSVSGTVFNDLNANGRQDPGEGGLSGRTLQLINVSDTTPVLIATTTTNANGFYKFDVFDGLVVGNWQINELLPSGWVATTTNPRTVNIPRGETFLDVDFGNFRTAAPSLGDDFLVDALAPPSSSSGAVNTPTPPVPATAAASAVDSSRPMQDEPSAVIPPGGGAVRHVQVDELALAHSLAADDLFVVV